MEIGKIIYMYVCVHQYLLPPLNIDGITWPGKAFFSDAFCAAIAALKNHAKRSHTFVYCSRYCVIFCLALTAQKASEMFRPKGEFRREFGYFEFSVAIGGLLGRD